MRFTALQKWMDDAEYKDHHIAKLTGVSRSHISRIRRGKSGANKALALRLQQITSIGWEVFIEPDVTVPPPLKVKIKRAHG